MTHDIYFNRATKVMPVLQKSQVLVQNIKKSFQQVRTSQKSASYGDSMHRNDTCVSHFSLVSHLCDFVCVFCCSVTSITLLRTLFTSITFLRLCCRPSSQPSTPRLQDPEESAGVCVCLYACVCVCVCVRVSQTDDIHACLA